MSDGGKLVFAIYLQLLPGLNFMEPYHVFVIGRF